MAVPVSYLKAIHMLHSKVQLLLCESLNTHDAGMLLLQSEGCGVFRHHSEKATLTTILSTALSYQQKQRAALLLAVELL